MASKKQLKKQCDKKCYFCPCDEYALLDSHRILPGEEGGKYTWHNMLTTCSLCHRKIHAGIIKIMGRYLSTSGKYVIHYTENDKEFWK